MEQEFTIENLEEAEKRQNLLYQIVSQSHTDLDEQLTQALKLTAELLEMEIGIISRVEEDSYIVEHFYAEDGGLEKGQKFELGNTYCAITLDNRNLVGIEHMKISSWKRHPCYEFFQMESYLGIPITIDDKVYGTLNFSSSAPKQDGFISADENLIRLLSEWVGGIIKRKEYKTQLNRRKELYKLISNNSADMICLHEPDGTYTFVSPSVKNILGYDQKELIGNNPYELFHPEDQERIKSESHQKALEKDPTRSFHYRIRKKDGMYIWFDTATETITNEHNEVINLQTTSRDITERKKLEILFDKAQQMANVGGWEFDIETGDIFWTDELYRIHDWEVDSPIDLEKGFECFPDDAQNTLQAAINNAVENGESYDLTLPFKSAKGQKKWVRAIGAALRANGKTYKLQGTFQDVTKQKEYQDKIDQQNKELTTLTEAQSKLYSIIGHDLKSAFFGINGMLELLMFEVDDYPELDKEFVEKLEMVEQSAGEAHQLFENLLDWTRMQKGSLKPDLVDIDIKAKIEKVIALLKSLAEQKGITLNVEFKSTPEIQGDKAMLATVFRNLITNALKFSESGQEVDITVSENNSHCLISVQDYGIGMPEEVKEHLFDPVSRPKRKGTNQEKGTGLGLLLCKEMIDLHNGSIKVNSEEGKGTEFIVSLHKKD